MPGALEGLRVIDFTTNLSGPYCAMLLGDQGADVIKVERPGGESMRQTPPFVESESAPFMLWNRNKRSIVLDLKREEDLRAAWELCVGADVVVENFRPGVMARLGLGYEVLSAENPGLVMTSISGFGQTGPYSHRGGFDLITQAMSGLAATNGPEDGPPFRLPIAISDVGAGMFGAYATMVALHGRERTGKGQQVDVSLYESAMSFCVYEAAAYFATGEVPDRIGQRHRGSSPYQILKAKDGYLAVGGAQQNLWFRICEVLGLSELTEDPRFRTKADRVANNDALIDIIQGVLETRPRDAWLADLEAAGVPAGPVMDHGEVFTDPHTVARDMVVPVDHPGAGPTRTIGTPVKLRDTPGGVVRPSPRVGEHTDEILAELRMRRNGTLDNRPGAPYKLRLEGAGA